MSSNKPNEIDKLAIKPNGGFYENQIMDDMLDDNCRG